MSASHLSVVSRDVNPKRDGLRPVVSKEMYQLRPKVTASCVFVEFPIRQPHAYELHRKIRECKVSKHLKVFIQFFVRYFVHNYMGTYRTVE